MSGSRARTQPAPGHSPDQSPDQSPAQSPELSPELSPAQQAAVAAGFAPDSGQVTTIAVDTTLPEDLLEPDLLTCVEDWRTQRRRYDTKIFRAAAAFADLHAPETDPAANEQAPGVRRRGGPVSRRYGGEGTPLVMDLAPMLLSVRLQRSTWSTSRLIADALDTRHRLPRLWDRVCAGEVEIWLVRKVAVASRHLSPDAAAYVDAAMAPLADGRLPTNRFLTRLQGKITQADPDLAEARARAARTDQFVRLGTANEHGILTLYARGLAQDLIHIDAMVDKLAHALARLGNTDPHDIRRARALGILANPLLACKILTTLTTKHTNDNDNGTGTSSGTDDDPPEPPAPPAPPEPPTPPEPPAPPDPPGPQSQRSCPVCAHPALPADPVTELNTHLPGWLPDIAKLNPADLLPPVTLYLHLAEETLIDGHGVARWEHYGPITLEHLKNTLGPTCRFTVKPVIDIPGLTPVDAYEAPTALAEGVHLRSPADTSPWGTSLADDKDTDHVIPYLPPDEGGPPAQTSLINLQDLVRYHHRVKTHAGWTVRQPFPGILIWRSPHHHYYLVDNTGTRKINGP